MATFTLRDLLTTTGQITVGDLTLSNFRRVNPTISSSNIVIETIEGDNPGLIVRTTAPLTSEDAVQNIGFEFRATASTAIIEGASVSLDDVDFETAGAGGSVEIDVSQAGRDDDNIGINVFVDNAAGVADVPEASDGIDGGPVATFRFQYELSLSPQPGVTATFTESTLLFDLASGPPTLPPGFDGLQYIASHADLIAAFGANAAAGGAHYLSNGQAEDRATDDFDEGQYVANYGDLQAAFGNDGDAATRHYIEFGFAEGRSDMDGLQYIASHDDLIPAFGANEAVGVAHHAQFGRDEGRAKDTFDETQYLANYGDLQAAFGGDAEAATVHYIQFGFAEGRVDEALV